MIYNKKHIYSTGDLTRSPIATLATKKYNGWVIADDRGTPTLSSSARVRVDVYDVQETLLMLNLNMNVEDFKAVKDIFIKNVKNELKAQYPNAKMHITKIKSKDGKIQYLYNIDGSAVLHSSGRRKLLQIRFAFTNQY